VSTLRRLGAFENCRLLDGLATTAARFNSPGAIAISSTGDVYVADTGNDTIRMIQYDGSNVNVSTLVGSPLNPGRQDGTGGNALSRIQAASRYTMV